MNNQNFKPPKNISFRDHCKPSVFLGGSIGKNDELTELCENWQETLSNKFLETNNWNVFNPRRDDWDSTWVQEFENPQFSQQVRWELDALDKANVIVIYFSPETKSPISLLELGLYASSGKVHVICPEGFWRKGNVDIVCNKYDIPQYNSINDFIERFIEYVK
jgi:hypothetical protein